MPAETPTIVFVHGAWADATGFDGSIRALRDRGFTVVGAANPLRHLTVLGRDVGDTPTRSLTGRRPPSAVEMFMSSLLGGLHAPP
jgi:hypothetical protein